MLPEHLWLSIFLVAVLLYQDPFYLPMRLYTVNAVGGTLLNPRRQVSAREGGLVLLDLGFASIAGAPLLR